MSERAKLSFDDIAKPKKREKGELTYDFENPGEIDEARFTLAATTPLPEAWTLF